MAEISIAGTRKSVTVDLVGETYEAYVPKPLVLAKYEGMAQKKNITPAQMVKIISDLVGAVFSPEDTKNVMARLNAPDDALDLEHVMELVKALTEYGAKDRPTTSRAD